MTRIRFFTENGLLSGVRISGHSGYSEAGSDIVCAAISSALRLAECELTDVLKLDTEVTVKEDGADITVKVKNDLIKAQSSLTALRMHYAELANEFPKNIKLLEV